MEVECYVVKANWHYFSTKSYSRMVFSTTAMVKIAVVCSNFIGMVLHNVRVYRRKVTKFVLQYIQTWYRMISLLRIYAYIPVQPQLPTNTLHITIYWLCIIPDWDYSLLYCAIICNISFLQFLQDQVWRNPLVCHLISNLPCLLYAGWGRYILINALNLFDSTKLYSF